MSLPLGFSLVICVLIQYDFSQWNKLSWFGWMEFIFLQLGNLCHIWRCWHALGQCVNITILAESVLLLISFNPTEVITRLWRIGSSVCVCVLFRNCVSPVKFIRYWTYNSCNYKLILRRLRKTLIAFENQYVLHTVTVCLKF